MPIKLGPFFGEIPKLSPRDLPGSYAEVAENCRLDRGMLEPMLRPSEVHVLGANADTIYRAADGTWLGWDAEVDVVEGPVASSRLYVTGDGPPKLRLVDGGVRPLALPSPANRPTISLLTNMREYLVIDSRDIRLVASTWKTAGLGLDINVSVTGSEATVTITSAAGITPAQAQTLVNGIAYKNTTTGALAPSLKLVEIKSIRDSGGFTLDADRNQVGADTRSLDGVVCKVFVGGTSLDETLAEPGPMDSTDETGQNDPPTLTTTPLHPTYAAASAPAVALFSATAISTIEASQTIKRIVLGVSGLSNGAIDRENSSVVIYSYTHVTDLDEESAPAPLSRQLLWSPGQAIRVMSFSTGSPTRGVDRYRIYRSITGATGDTDLYFVAEVPRLTAVFIDEVNADLTGEPIPTMDFSTPPDGLRGITSMPNGMIAAFNGRSLYFAEPYKPHAWPESYALTTDFPIVGLASIGSALAVLTTGKPYLAQGTHPENMRMEVIEQPRPCIAKRSIVPMGYGVAYASSDGLVLLDAQGGARLVSKNVFTARQWYVEMNPSTFRASRLDDLYALSYDPDGAARRMSLIDLSGEVAHVVRTTDLPSTFFLQEHTGRLFYLEGARRIQQFDPTVSGSGRRTYRWRSRLFVDAGATNLGAGYVECDAEDSGSFSVRLLGDGVQRAVITRANQILTLPGGYRAKRWQIEISGTRQINAVILAHSVAEIAKMVR